MTIKKYVMTLALPNVLMLAVTLPAYASPALASPAREQPLVLAADSSAGNTSADATTDSAVAMPSSTSSSSVANSTPGPSPDNSAVNQQDRSNGEPTADQAKNNMSDRDVMRTIRKAVMADKSLSTNGHNVKIIAQNGKVTLKGPVASEQEKQSIEAKATQVVGDGNVTDKIAVTSAN